MINLSEQLRNWRSRHRLNQLEAATVLGVTPGLIEDLERGIHHLRTGVVAALIEKLSQPPSKESLSHVQDPGYRPAES